ncbi:hypothetical protein [Bacteroides acidifaciens]|uniref:hypothetical protein n=1 Tax=Bacteroides acidifaciens TaxID=85831 RepID=UPI00262ABD9D|nr:hypothetical protein [Bacteroides acidifaciens]
MSINITHKDIDDLFERLGIPLDSQGNMDADSYSYFREKGSGIASDYTIPYKPFICSGTVLEI